MNKPVPRATAETKPFWDGCAVGELRYQACARCSHVQAFPRAFCSSCRYRDLQWRVSAGHGRILSHTTVYRAPTPAFRAAVPYVIALVDMDEGFRLMVNVAGGDSPAVAIGRPVRIGFGEVEGIHIPHAEVIE
jgi:uncharacterized OB-fold protein